MTGIAAQGAALFLFIPLVLFLFLRQPLGPGWSVLAGLAVMVGHRFVAAPWMAKWADVRCLWCGRVGSRVTLAILAGGRERQMSACSVAHAVSVARFLDFVVRHRIAMALGIFLPLAWLLSASLAASLGHPLLPHDLSALGFRVVVAATVVTASLVPVVRRPLVNRSQPPAGGDSAADRVLGCPFPLHNLFLLGIGNTLWVFRLVGAWWLIDGAIRLAR